MARERPTTPIGQEKPYDERLYRRGPQGLSRATVGLIAVVVIAIGTYLAFAKSIPFVGPGYEAKAVFENAATLRETAPVRIAGVNVGEVTGVQAEGNTAESAFTVDDEGLPLHTDTELEVRPRLFLEGNYFLATNPGSASAGAAGRRHDPRHPDLDRGPARRGPDHIAEARPQEPRRVPGGFGGEQIASPRPRRTGLRTPTSRARAAPRRSTTRSSTAGRRVATRRSSTRRCSASSRTTSRS